MSAERSGVERHKSATPTGGGGRPLYDLPHYYKSYTVRRYHARGGSRLALARRSARCRVMYPLSVI